MHKKILEAIFLTYEHSKQLFEDAEFLYKHQKPERAYTFYHFSFEESGRLFILARTLFNYLKGEIPLNKLNIKLLNENGYRDHIIKLKEASLKLVSFSYYDSILQNNKENEDNLLNFYDNLKEKIPKLNNNKNKSIYLCFENNNFKKPSDNITEDDIFYIRAIAEMQLINIEKNLFIFLKKDTNLIEMKNEIKEKKINKQNLAKLNNNGKN